MSRNFVYTDLALKDAVVLEIEGTPHQVVQFTASWAVNEMPTAACMLAIGRNARTNKPAAIHTDNAHAQMVRAKVYINPSGDYDHRRQWPAGRRIMFDGFLTGFTYRKIAGKVHAIANLIHWLAALGFSSAITKAGHVANPTQLNAAAILGSLKDGGGGQGVYVSQFVAGEVIAPNVQADLWKALKGVFCGLANRDLLPTAKANACDGGGAIGKNDAALEALARIEGPADGCAKDYKWGVALKLDTQGVTRIEEAITKAVGHATIESYANATFWDKLVGTFCPMFGMAVVPLVESALVVADTPALAGQFWKEVTPNDYDSFDMTAELHRPLRGVGVVSTWAGATGAGIESASPGSEPIIGGCYVEDSVRPGDGVIMYVAPPAWLTDLKYLPGNAGRTTGVAKDQPGKTATTPDPAMDRENTLGDNAARLYSRFAHSVYVANMLRGRGGSASGRLRFDIAPGSIVKMRASTEKFIGAEDDLAVTQFACVNRVTVGINAEAGMAGTTFLFSHTRTETENGKPRTSVDEHPLFGSAIHGNGKHGAPLIDEYAFED